MIPPPKSAESRTIWNVLIGLAAGLALVAGVNFIYTQTTATDFKKLNDGSWKVAAVGSPIISFQTPVELTNTSRPNNEREREFIAYQMSSTYKEGRDLIIVATVISYLSHVYIDPMAAEQSVKGLEQLYRAEDITFETKQIMVGNNPSKRINGSFHIGDRNYIFSRVNVIYGNLVRDLLVIVKDGDPEAARLLERMVTSVGVEG